MSTVQRAMGWILREATDNYHLGLVREALSALSDGVARCSKRIADAHASGNSDYADSVTDEECDVVETLLGSAFTVCQTHIAQVVADVKKLHVIAGRPNAGRPGVALATTTTRKSDIMRFGCPQVSGTSVTVIEAINALANYFKHGDEWPRDWAQATGQAADTIRVITAVGLSRGSSGNLRRGARSLGNKSFDDMDVFGDLLGSWHENVMSAYELEIKGYGLIT